MPKPPSSPPSSDLAGVHRDRRRIDTPANAAGNSGEKLKRAEKESAGRPDHSEDQDSKDDRSA